MNPVVTALAKQIPLDSVIEYLVTKYPHMREKVAFAMDSGYSANDIIKMLKSYDKKGFQKAVKEAIPKKEKQRVEDMNRRGRNLTLAEQAQASEMQNIEKRKGQLKAAGKAALGIGGLYASPRIIPYILEKASPVIAKGLDLYGQLKNKRGMPQPGPQVPTQPSQPSIPIESTPQAAPPAGQGTPQQPGPLTPAADELPQVPELQAVQQKQADVNQLWDLAQRGKTQGNPFLKAANKLIKDGNITDPQKFKQFHDWWNATQEHTTSPVMEFEKFRTETKGMFEPTTKSVETGSKLVEGNFAKGDRVTLPNGKSGNVKDVAKKVATVVRDDGKSGQYRVQDLKRLEEAQPKAQEYAPAIYKMPGESTEEWDKRKTIAKAAKKAAHEIVQGKTFLDFGPIPKEALGVSGLSVAEDVLNFLAGNSNAYEVLDDDDREEIQAAKDIYGAQITPNMVWNMLVTQEPKLAKTESRPKSVKGKETVKGGLMGSSEFRRSLTHMVYGIISGKSLSTELHDKITKISTARALAEQFADAFKAGKQKKMNEEMEKLMDDEYFNSLFTEEIEDMVKKFR